MKKINYILSLLVIAFTISCDSDPDNITTIDRTGGILQLDKELIGYVVGDNGTYTASGKAYQGAVKTTHVDIYKTFTNSVTGESSNEALLSSIDITSTTTGTNSTYSSSFNYADLISGLTIGGAAISANDGDLNIGDYWTLRYASTTSEGYVNTNYKTTKVAVGTRFAGVYKVIASDYWRIGVQSGAANWVGEERVIESVDATTYRHIGVGPFDVDTVVAGFGYDATEAHLFFSITALDEVNYEGVGNTTLLTQPYMSCVTDPAEFNNVPCDATSNYVVRDNVDGKDLIYMTYGYLTPGSGPREFYEVLEKIVD